MKTVTVALLAIALCAVCVKDVRPMDVQCEWRYPCCEWNEATGGCMALCQKAIVACDTHQEPTTPTDRPQKNRLNVITTPCKEGYKMDRMNMCRRVF